MPENTENTENNQVFQPADDNGKDFIGSTTMWGLLLMLLGPVFGLTPEAAGLIAGEIGPIITIGTEVVATVLILFGRFRDAVKPINSIFGKKFR